MEAFYQLLERIGYFHPMHPPITHVPVGLVIGAFILGILSLLFRSQATARAARYCMLIAFVSMFFTVLLGYMDWQHFYAGGWLRPIKFKLLLAAILLVLSFIALIASKASETNSLRVTGLYTLCMLTVLGLGFFGGEILYSGRVPPAPAEFMKGERLFRGNCSGCHPYGTNIVAPDAPLRGSDEYKDQQTFLHWIRDPRMNNGARGVMPPFPASRISDAQAGELLKYIVQVMGPPAPAPSRSTCDVSIPAFTVKTDEASIAIGKEIFEANCKYCHTVASTETVVGPGLKGILKRQTFPVGNWPATPENVFRQLRCPYQQMPSFKERLKDEQVYDLVSYLNTQ